MQLVNAPSGFTGWKPPPGVAAGGGGAITEAEA